jgi:hypothetical protein
LGGRHRARPDHHHGRVKQPEVEHRMRDLKAWLQSNGRSPAEMSLKIRLRELLTESPISPRPFGSTNRLSVNCIRQGQLK